MKEKDKSLQLLIIDFFLFSSLVVSIVLLWDSTILSSLIALVIVCLGFIFFHTKEDVVFFVVAALFGSVAEIIIIAFGAWQYGNPVMFGLAPWAPLFWGFAYLFGRRVRDTVFQLGHLARHYTRHEDAPHPTAVLIFDIALYIVMLVLAHALWETSFVLLALYALILFIVLYRFHTPADMFFVLLAIIVGTVLEAIATSSGAWTHNNAEFWGMPIWLPVAYGLFSIIVRRTAVTLNIVLFKKSHR